MNILSKLFNNNIKNNQPIIYYFCPIGTKPSGGINVIYEHVAILNKNGRKAYILHKANKFKAKIFYNYNNQNYILWYKNIKNLKFKINDIIVIPEVKAVEYFKYNNLKHTKKIIFNQGCYFSFKKYNYSDEQNNNLLNNCVYNNPSLLATLVVSQDSYDYLNFTFPKLNNIFRIYNKVDNNLFYYKNINELNNSKIHVSYMTRRNPELVSQVISILKLRNNNNILNNVNFIAIDNLDSSQVAQAMQKSQIFLCFGTQEGFQLPPAEAMACGCITIGFTGGGANEFMKKDISYPIENYNIIDFVKTIEDVIIEYKNNPNRLNIIRENCSKFIKQNYSEQIQEQSVLQFWDNILNKTLTHEHEYQQLE